MRHQFFSAITIIILIIIRFRVLVTLPLFSTVQYATPLCTSLSLSLLQVASTRSIPAGFNYYEGKDR